jgi:hypothetical protein
MITFKGHTRVAIVLGSMSLFACLLLFWRARDDQGETLIDFKDHFQKQSPGSGNKTVVMAKIKTEDTDWVEEGLPG